MFQRITLAKVEELRVSAHKICHPDDFMPNASSNLRKVQLRIAPLALCALLLASCAPLAAPATPTPAPAATLPPAPNAPQVSATATALPAAAPASNANVGYLTGHVSIGPLTPVERVGVPSPTPAPEVYAARSINIFQANGVTLVVNVKINSDGTYRVELPPGDYVAALARSGIDRARGLPKPITIEIGKTVQVDVDIDTGIR